MAFSRLPLQTMYGRKWWDSFDYPSKILDQNFGTCLLETDMHQPVLYRGFFLRPRTISAEQKSGSSVVKNDDDKFKIKLSVNHFKPEEIEVKVVDDFIVIHGKHEEMSDDHGSIQREFTRRYLLPERTEAETVKSSMSDDGILTIVAPKKKEASPVNERIVPITLSGGAGDDM